MAAPDSDNLRTLYQESASLFLSACAQKKKQKATPPAPQAFDPTIMATARSLMLRSMYDTPISSSISSGNNSKCIVSKSSITTNNSETVNLIRSGGMAVSVPVETGEEEVSRVMEQHDKFRDTIMFADEMNAEVDVRQLADSIASDMFSTFMSVVSDMHRNTVRHDFFCKSCGGPLLPLPLCIDGGMGMGMTMTTSTIRLKTLKRGKSRRRRASRLAAKKYAFDSNILQKHKGGGRSFSHSHASAGAGAGMASSHGSAVASVMDTQAALKAGHAARRIRDGISKNCISYKCGCGHEQSMKGVRRQRGNEVDMGNKQAKDLNTKQSHPSAKRTGGRTNVQVVSRDDSEDFMQLSGSTTNPVPETKLKPLQQGKKRKATPAKPKKPAKKSGLSDFLSSLND